MALPFIASAASAVVPLIQASVHHKEEKTLNEELVEKSIKHAETLYKDETSRTERHHLEQVELATRLYQHERDMNLKMHLQSLKNELKQHLQQMGYAAETSRRESVRDVWAQKNTKADAMLLTATLMLDATFSAVIQGVLPDNTSNLFVMAFAVSVGVSFIFLFVSVWFNMQAQRRMAGFNMYNKSQRYVCGKAHKNFDSYYDCHCAFLTNCSTQSFYFGILSLVLATAIYAGAHFIYTFHQPLAAIIFASLLFVGFCVLLVLNFFWPTKTRAGSTPQDGGQDIHTVPVDGPAHAPSRPHPQHTQQQREQQQQPNRLSHSNKSEHSRHAESSVVSEVRPHGATSMADVLHPHRLGGDDLTAFAATYREVASRPSTPDSPHMPTRPGELSPVCEVVLPRLPVPEEDDDDDMTMYTPPSASTSFAFSATRSFDAFDSSSDVERLPLLEPAITRARSVEVNSADMDETDLFFTGLHDMDMMGLQTEFQVSLPVKAKKRKKKKRSDRQRALSFDTPAAAVQSMETLANQLGAAIHPDPKLLDHCKEFERETCNPLPATLLHPASYYTGGANNSPPAPHDPHRVQMSHPLMYPPATAALAPHAHHTQLSLPQIRPTFDAVASTPATHTTTSRPGVSPHAAWNLLDMSESADDSHANTPSQSDFSHIENRCMPSYLERCSALGYFPKSDTSNQRLTKSDTGIGIQASTLHRGNSK